MLLFVHDSVFGVRGLLYDSLGFSDRQQIGHHQNLLRRRLMNYGLARNQSCRFLKFGVAMLM